MNRPTNQRSIMHQFLNVVLNRPVVQRRSSTRLEGDATRENMLPKTPDTFERIEEYKAILDNLAELSARRQRTNDVFVTLNTIFLSALGFILLQSHLNTWWVFAVVSAVTLIIMPMNVTWLAALRRYGRSLYFRYDYLREIEQEFRARRGNGTNLPEIGLFLRNKEANLDRKGNPGQNHTALEIYLATYFICLYPAISLLVGILVYLVETGLIPPLKLL